LRVGQRFGLEVQDYPTGSAWGLAGAAALQGLGKRLQTWHRPAVEHETGENPGILAADSAQSQQPTGAFYLVCPP
jgi:hypothetical protein